MRREATGASNQPQGKGFNGPRPEYTREATGVMKNDGMGRGDPYTAGMGRGEVMGSPYSMGRGDTSGMGRGEVMGNPYSMGRGDTSGMGRGDGVMGNPYGMGRGDVGMGRGEPMVMGTPYAMGRGEPTGMGRGDGMGRGGNPERVGSDPRNNLPKGTSSPNINKPIGFNTTNSPPPKAKEPAPAPKPQQTVTTVLSPAANNIQRMSNPVVRLVAFMFSTD